MRLTINKSYVKTVRRKNEASSALIPERLCAVAILQLYGEPDPIKSYQDTSYHCDKLMMECLKGQRKPVPNAHQETLNRLCPLAARINLYLTTRSAPNLIISLVRDENNLFRLATHHIRQFKDLPPRDGVFMSWADTTPPPYTACGLPPRFTRILRGGRAISAMIAEVQADYELRRQLTNCVRLHEILASPDAKPGRITVWHYESLGKVTFSVDKTTYPFTFTGLSARPNARIGDKFRVKVYGDAPTGSSIGQQSRYFVPSIKGATHDTPLPARTLGVLKELLMLHLTPVIGVLSDKSVDTYALHYDGIDLDPTFLQTVKMKLERLPWFVPGDREHYASPNEELLGYLREALLEPPSPEAYSRGERLSALVQIFNQFTDMRPGPQALIDYFEGREMPFTDDEKEQVLLVH